jgi:hypothetical protein
MVRCAADCCNLIYPAKDCFQDAFPSLRLEPEAIDRIDV